MEKEELVRMMIVDDADALEELMRRTQKDIFRLAYLISGSYADSEDIVQETYVQVYRKRKTIRDPGAFQPWLFRTATRIARSYLKKKRREQPAGENMEEWQESLLETKGSWTLERGRAESAAETAERNEEARELYRAISRLPVKQRTVVILYYFEEMTAREIAEISGCLEGTVKSRLHAARKKLKMELYGGRAPEERRASV